MGFSDQRVPGSAGIVALARACAPFGRSARVCDSAEVLASPAPEGAAEGSAWLRPTWEGPVDGLSFDASGLRALIPEYLTCQGWGGNPSMPSGTLRPPTGLTVSAAGRFSLEPCAEARAVACCRPHRSAPPAAGDEKAGSITADEAAP